MAQLFLICFVKGLQPVSVVEIGNQCSKIWLRFLDILQGRNCVLQCFAENNNGVLYFRPLIYRHLLLIIPCLWNYLAYQIYL